VILGEKTGLVVGCSEACSMSSSGDDDAPLASRLPVKSEGKGAQPRGSVAQESRGGHAKTETVGEEMRELPRGCESENEALVHHARLHGGLNKGYRYRV
jgi:hypothetical protein